MGYRVALQPREGNTPRCSADGCKLARAAL
jgi:hypothetical protein